MYLLAHRGVSAHYHENTLLAFEKSLSTNIIGIEFDLHQVDDAFYIFHDFQLDRLLSQAGDIRHLDQPSISKLRLKDGQHIPELFEIFNLVKGECLLNIELKHITDASVLLEHINRYLYEYDHAKIVISSFNHFLVKQLQGLVRDTRFVNRIKFAAIIAHLPLDLAQYAIDMQVDIAAIDADLVSKEFVEHAHMYNIDVWSYTVNTEYEFNKLRSMGVDAVFTNDPELLSGFEAAHN